MQDLHTNLAIRLSCAQSFLTFCSVPSAQRLSKVLHIQTKSRNVLRLPLQKTEQTTIALLQLATDHKQQSIRQVKLLFKKTNLAKHFKKKRKKGPVERKKTEEAEEKG